MFRAEESLCLFAGDGFDVVDVIAAAVIAVGGISFRVLIGQEVAHRGLCRQGAIVFARDEFQVAPLGFELFHHGGGDLGTDGSYLLKVGDVRHEGRIYLVGRNGRKIGVKRRLIHLMNSPFALISASTAQARG